MTATDGPEITYDNLTGRCWFRLDRLVELAGLLQERIPDARDFRIWYDEAEDHHRLRFTAGGRTLTVRYYKVFAIDEDATLRTWDNFPDLLYAVWRLLEAPESL